jgi:hypothetical protein
MNCGHEGCTCAVEQEGGFCSDYCRDHAGEAAHSGHACECGHSECQAAMA